MRAVFALLTDRDDDPRHRIGEPHAREVRPLQFDAFVLKKSHLMYKSREIWESNAGNDEHLG